jgi:hypothetical protein
MTGIERAGEQPKRAAWGGVLPSFAAERAIDVAVLLIMALDEIDDWYCSALLRLQALCSEPYRREARSAIAAHCVLHAEGAELGLGTGRSRQTK